jgi:hypothetical protein
MTLVTPVEVFLVSVALKPTSGSNKLSITNKPLTLIVKGLFVMSIVHKTGKLL